MEESCPSDFSILTQSIASPYLISNGALLSEKLKEPKCIYPVICVISGFAGKIKQEMPENETWIIY